MQWVTQKKLTCYSLVVRRGNPQSDGLSSENTDQPMATIGLDEGSLVCSDGKGGSAVMTISKMIITLAIVLVGLVFATRSKMDQIRAAVKPTQGCSAEDVLGRYGSATTGLINSASDPSAVTLPTFMPFAEAAIFVSKLTETCPRLRREIWLARLTLRRLQLPRRVRTPWIATRAPAR